MWPLKEIFDTNRSRTKREGDVLQILGLPMLNQVIWDFRAGTGVAPPSHFTEEFWVPGLQPYSEVEMQEVINMKSSAYREVYLNRGIQMTKNRGDIVTSWFLACVKNFHISSFAIKYYIPTFKNVFSDTGLISLLLEVMWQSQWFPNCFYSQGLFLFLAE